MRKRRVVGRIYGMIYSSKGLKDRNGHKNRIKRSEQAWLVYVRNINLSIPTTWRWACGSGSKGTFTLYIAMLSPLWDHPQSCRSCLAEYLNVFVLLGGCTVCWWLLPLLLHVPIHPLPCCAILCTVIWEWTDTLGRAALMQVALLRKRDQSAPLGEFLVMAWKCTKYKYSLGHYSVQSKTHSCGQVVKAWHSGTLGCRFESQFG